MADVVEAKEGIDKEPTSPEAESKVPLMEPEEKQEETVTEISAVPLSKEDEEKINKMETETQIDIGNPIPDERTKFARPNPTKTEAVSGVLQLSYAALISTAICTVCLAIVAVVPIAMIVVGAVYFNKCPAQPMIPIYLIVGGVFNLLRILIYIIFRMEKLKDYEKKVVILFRINELFMFAWFIAGCVWTYQIYKPEYVDVDSDQYCHKGLYLFAFWSITSCFILIGSLGIFIAIFTGILYLSVSYLK